MKSYSDTDDGKSPFITSLDTNILFAANNNDLQTIKKLLNDETQVFNIFEAVDSKHYTIFHLSALNGLPMILKFFLNYAKKQIADLDVFEQRLRMSRLINKKSTEGFTALHLASFKGCIDSIEILIENEADMNELNYQGLNCIHIAAQGDQPISLVYFKNKGLPLFEKDSKGSTALHWAAYIGCENSMNFLLKWCANEINVQDKEGGLTPLHLAVISGNTRIVRKLLLKGASRNIKDKQEKTPEILARENEFHNIEKILVEKEGIAEFCNIRPTFKPTKKKYRSLLLFIILYVYLHITNILFTFPYIENDGWIIIYILLMIFNFMSFIVTVLRNPGYLPLNKKENLLEILKNYDCTSVCPECEIIKPARSRHCEICKRCVAVYDHHCPWINNCVGAKNHSFFFMFILTTWMSLCYAIIIAGHSINADKKKDWSYTFEDYFYTLRISFMIFGFIIVGFFFIPICMLLWVQLCNFFLNKTTSERFAYAAKVPENKSSESLLDLETVELRKSKNKLNEKSMGEYIRNCYLMCYGNSKIKMNVTGEKKFYLN